MADQFEGWTEEPAAPAAAAQQAADPFEGWTEQPATAASIAAPPTPVSIDYVGDLERQASGLSDPYAGQRAQYQEQHEAENDFIRKNFKASAEPGVSPELQELQLAKALDIPLGVVKANRAAWADQFAKVNGDPEAWRTQYPLSAKLVLDHPEIAEHVVANKELNVLLQGWNKVTDFAVDANVWAREHLPGYGSGSTPDQVAAYRAADAEQIATRDTRNLPKPTDEVDDAAAAAIREGGTYAVVKQRAIEGQAQLDVSKLYSRLLQARAVGQDTTALERQIYVTEKDSTPKYLGETGVTQALSESVGTSMSTLDVLRNVAARGGASAAVGYVAGGAIGALATKNPLGAAEGASIGASALGKFGSTYGAAEGSFILESGDSYKQLLDLKTDTGQSLTEPEARGGALIAASIKTGIELVELHGIMKALGPAGGIIEGGGIARVKELLATNPGFRTLAVRAAKAWAGEGLEEVFQEGADEGVAYLAASKHDNPEASDQVVSSAGSLDFFGVGQALASAKGQKGPIFSPEKLKENFAMGLMGGALFGVGGLVVSATSHAIFQSKEARGALQVPELAKLAADPSAAAMATDVAKLVSEKAAEHGDELTHMYPDAGAFRRLFQTSEEADAKATELLGENGPQKLAEAIATGGKLEVPLADYLGKWGKDDVAGRLVDDTATQFGHQTPRQLQENAKVNEEWAQKIAAGEEKSETLERFDKLEEELVSTGTHTKSEAAQAMAPLREVFSNFAKKFGRPTEELFRDVRILVDDGTKALVLLHKKANASERLSAELHDNKGLKATERAKRLYVDPVSGLRTRRGWEHSARQAGQQVAIITSPDVKAINDHLTGGHDTANELLRVIGAAVGKHDAEAARSGTNFLLHVRGQAHLAQVLADVQKALPDAKLGLEGVMGPTLDKELFDKLDKHTDAKRAAGHLPARGSTNFDLSKLGETVFSKERAKPNLSQELIGKAASLSPKEFFRQAYQDAEVPGVLSSIAWDQLPRKAHVASIDIKGLKDINALGKDVGDRLLKLFAQVVERNDAADFDFAHLSGDEYAAQHDDPVKLKAWLDHVRAELTKVHLKIEDVGKDGAVVGIIKVKPEFRGEVGEKTYGAADRALNAAKLKAKQRTAAGNDAGAGSGVRQGESGSQVPAGQFERRGAPAQGFVDRLDPEVTGGRLFSTQGFTDLAREGIERVFRIGLEPTSNKSTFLHESAHVFLELFGDLANRAEAPQSVRDDYSTALKWLGVENGAAITTEQHEKWAKAFEAYLAEGKAPVDRLTGSFQRFKLWMLSAYKKLSTLGEVNPEIRGVFDRLLASDREIEATKERMGLRALPREALGMTGEEYAAHLDKLEQASSHGSQVADLQIAKDKLRETEAWWKLEHRNRTAAAEAEFEDLPARKAQLILSGKPAGDWLGMTAPLSRPVVESMLGKKAAAKFHLSAEGIHPDEIAELLGYGTGKGMLEAITQLPEKAGWVDARAEQSMREAFPGVLDEREKLREFVAGGLHSQASKEFVLKEWQALNSKGPKDAPHPPPVEVLRRAAEIMAAGRTVGRLGVTDAIVAERTAANNAARAALVGNYELAAVYKQQQLLNMYLHTALQGAKKETERFLAKAAQLSKLPARQRLGKASPIFRDAVDSLLATFDLKEPEPGVTVPLDTLLGDVERTMNDDQTSVGFDRARIVDRASRRGMGGWKELAVEDMRQVFNALKNIEAAARNRNEVILDEKRADMEEVVAGLEREAELLDKRPPELTRESESLLQGLGRSWTSFDGSLLQIETMSRWLAGAKNTAEFLKSFWFKSIVKPMQDAKVKETDLYRQHVEPIVEAFDAMPDETRSKMMDKVDGRKLFPNHIEEKLPSRRYEILMMLLNAGNASNLERLTEGRNITEDELRAAAITVGVTKEEYAWLQSVGDASEGLKPLAFDLEERDSGIRPEAITARPFETPHGKMKGWYFPAVYDRDVTLVGKKQEAQRLADFQDQSYTRISTSNSSLKARVDGFTDVISLSPGSINRHFAQTVHDVAFREAVKSIGKLLLNDQVQTVLRERLGAGRGDQFVQWAKDVASMRGVEGSIGTQKLMEWARMLRGNIVQSVLGYKLPNAAEDFTSNLIAAVAATDLKTRHLAGAFAEFGASPRESRALALEKSGELRTRKGQVARELAKRIKDLTQSGVSRVFNKGPLGFYKTHAFAFAEAVEVATATPIWLGAYRQALQEMGPQDGTQLEGEAATKLDSDAVNFADATVRQALVSHNTVDVSAIMRDKGIIGHLTMFAGAFNKFYNQGRDAQHQFAHADSFGEKARIAGTALGLAVGYFVIGSLARGQGPGKDEQLPDWLVRKLLLEGVLQLTPVSGAVGTAAAQRYQGKKFQARNNSLYGVLESVTDSLITAADSDEDAGTRVRALLNAAGPLTGNPTASLVQSGGPALEWAFDANDWRNPFDAASDLTYGKKADQPWNAIQAAGDELAGGAR